MAAMHYWTGIAGSDALNWCWQNYPEQRAEPLTAVGRIVGGMPGAGVEQTGIAATITKMNRVFRQHVFEWNNLRMNCWYWASQSGHTGSWTDACCDPFARRQCWPIDRTELSRRKWASPHC